MNGDGARDLPRAGCFGNLAAVPRGSKMITLIPSRLVSFFGGEAFSICIVSEAETDTPRGGYVEIQRTHALVLHHVGSLVSRVHVPLGNIHLQE